MEVFRQGKDKGSSIAKLAQEMYYKLLDEYNELEQMAKKPKTSKIIIKLQVS